MNGQHNLVDRLKLSGLLLLLLATGCDFLHDEAGEAAHTSPQGNSGSYITVEWTQLMPEADLQALLNPPAYLNEIEEGSAQDQQLFEQLASASPDGNADRYQQALVSTDIRSEYDGESVRIAGYLVPLEFDGPEVVTQAFLVPYFGACIHVPPPPPNQIVLLDASEGVSLDDMYNPYWVSGELSAELHEKELGTSAYQMKVEKIEQYSE
jgi:hypothetical protein